MAENTVEFTDGNFQDEAGKRGSSWWTFGHPGAALAAWSAR